MESLHMGSVGFEKFTITTCQSGCMKQRTGQIPFCQDLHSSGPWNR